MAEAGALGPGSTTFALAAPDGVRLRAAVLAGAGARGLVVLLQGRTEFIEKYADVAAAFAERGLGVATLDWRGQGGSARPVGHPRKGHVDSFDAYQRDLAALLAHGPVAGLPGPRVMVAHSMGGAIGLRALAAGGHGFAAAIFSAPMWGVSMPFQGGLRMLARGACALGLGRVYARMSGDTPYVETGFDGNVLTADPDQFARLVALARARPELMLGAPTLGWLNAAFDEMAALRAVALATPSLLLVGGDEAVVSPAEIARRASAGGHRLVRIDGARHETFFETPARRAVLWRAIDDFLAARGL